MSLCIIFILIAKCRTGLLSWNIHECLVDLEKELAVITEQGLEGEEARFGERLIQFASENLVTEILIHPVVSTLAQCMRNLLSSFTRHRHIIHAGYTFAANGSWALQDGTFSYADFAEAFQEIEVKRVIRAYENGISIDIHCSPEGEWTKLPKENFTKACKVRVNPTDVLTSGSPAITDFSNYLAPFLISAPLENLLESSDVVGNIRFSRPTLYIFPGGQGDAALFGINGFNMLLDGGYSRKACFWDFVRHLDRLDAVLMTRLNNSNVGGISSVLRRKRQDALYPQIGHFFCNLQERKSLLSPDGDKDRDPLLINLLDEGQDMILNLRHLNLAPQICYRDSEPINLYHKVGHGTLDMYVLSPAKDSKEVREFLQKWNQSDQKLFANVKSSREFIFPVQNLISIAALLVWKPANPNDTITRILYPGSSTQKKIFEGLDRLRNLECIRHAVFTENSLTPVSVKKTVKENIIEKNIPKEKIIPEKKEGRLIENNVIAMNGEAKEKSVKKSDSTESERSLKTKKIEDAKIIENGEKPKPKPRPAKPRSDSQHRKKPADKKDKPSPKRSLENGDVKKPTAKQISPSATPAKSTKDANNRKVIESKSKRELPPKSAPSEPKPKVERKPISRRPKETPKVPVSPAKKLVNGVQKPDSISRKGKFDKEGTTDSSTVSTPSADQESILKKDISKLTPEEMQRLKAQELADLKEEQEAVKEIEAVFRKSEVSPKENENVRVVKDISLEDKIEKEDILIVEKLEIEHDSLEEKEDKEDETQKLARDSEESEKIRKLSREEMVSEKLPEIEEQVNGIVNEAEEILKAKDEPVKAGSPEEKLDVSTDKKIIEKDLEEEKDVVESQPDEKVSINIKSGDTTTAPTLPEDERIPLDEIKEDNGQIIEEKHVKEETKEKEVPAVQPQTKPFDSLNKLPNVVGIRLDKQAHIRDIIKTPDEVADLPVHEEVDYEFTHEMKQETTKTNEIEEKEYDKEKTMVSAPSKELLKESEQEKDKDDISPTPPKVKSESPTKDQKELVLVDEKRESLHKHKEEITDITKIDTEEKPGKKTVTEAVILKEYREEADKIKEHKKDQAVEEKDKSEDESEGVPSIENVKKELEKLEKERKDLETIDSKLQKLKDGELLVTQKQTEEEHMQKEEFYEMENLKHSIEAVDKSSQEKMSEERKPEDKPLSDEKICDKIQPLDDKLKDTEHAVPKLPAVDAAEEQKPDEKQDNAKEEMEDHKLTAEDQFDGQKRADITKEKESDIQKIENKTVPDVEDQEKGLKVDETHEDIKIDVARRESLRQIEEIKIQKDVEHMKHREEKTGISEKTDDKDELKKEVKEKEICKSVPIHKDDNQEKPQDEVEIDIKDKKGIIESKKDELINETNVDTEVSKHIEVSLLGETAEKGDDNEIKDASHAPVGEQDKMKDIKDEKIVKDIRDIPNETSTEITEKIELEEKEKKISETDKSVKIFEDKLQKSPKEEEAKLTEELCKTDKVDDEKRNVEILDKITTEQVSVGLSEHLEDGKPSKVGDEEIKRTTDQVCVDTREDLEDEKVLEKQAKDFPGETSTHKKDGEVVELVKGGDKIESLSTKETAKPDKVHDTFEDKLLSRKEGIPDVDLEKEKEVDSQKEKVFEGKDEVRKTEDQTSESKPLSDKEKQEILKEIDIKDSKPLEGAISTEESHKAAEKENLQPSTVDKIGTEHDTFKDDKEKGTELKDEEDETTADNTGKTILCAEQGQERKMSQELIERMELGRKSPKEREEDVIKIVASVAEVLKSDAPLEEFEGKIPYSSYPSSYTTELRETHITTMDSPMSDQPKDISEPIQREEEKQFISDFLTKEREHTFTGDSQTDKRSQLLKESQELMMASSRIISDIKSGKSEEKLDEEDAGTVHRMLVTASSEDGGEEIELCAAGTITFSKSSESSGRSSPEQSQKVSQKSSLVETISESLSTVKLAQDASSGKDSGIDDGKSDIQEKISSPPSTEKSDVLEKLEVISGKSTPDRDSIKSQISDKSVSDTSDVEKSKDISSSHEDLTKLSQQTILEDKSSSHLKEEVIHDEKDSKPQDIIKDIKEELTEEKKDLQEVVLTSKESSEEAGKKLKDKVSESLGEAKQFFSGLFSGSKDKAETIAKDTEKAIDDVLKPTEELKEIRTEGEKEIKVKSQPLDEKPAKIKEDDQATENIIKGKDSLNELAVQTKELVQEVKGDIEDITAKTEDSTKHIKESISDISSDSKIIAEDVEKKIVTDIDTIATKLAETIEEKLEDARDDLEKEFIGMKITKEETVPALKTSIEELTKVGEDITESEYLKDSLKGVAKEMKTEDNKQQQADVKEHHMEDIEQVGQIKPVKDADDKPKEQFAVGHIVSDIKELQESFIEGIATDMKEQQETSKQVIEEKQVDADKGEREKAGNEKITETSIQEMKKIQDSFIEGIKTETIKDDSDKSSVDIQKDISDESPEVVESKLAPIEYNDAKEEDTKEKLDDTKEGVIEEVKEDEVTDIEGHIKIESKKETDLAPIKSEVIKVEDTKDSIDEVKKGAKEKDTGDVKTEVKEDIKVESKLEIELAQSKLDDAKVKDTKDTLDEVKEDAIEKVKRDDVTEVREEIKVKPKFETEITSIKSDVANDTKETQDEVKEDAKEKVYEGEDKEDIKVIPKLTKAEDTEDSQDEVKENAKEKVKEEKGSFFSGIKSFFGQAKEKVDETIKKTHDDTKELSTKTQETIGEIKDEAVGIIETNLKDAEEHLIETVKDTHEKIKIETDLKSEQIRDVKHSITENIEQVTKQIEESIEDSKDKLKDKKDFVELLVKDTKEDLKDVKEHITEMLKDTEEEFIKKTESTISESKEQVVDAIDQTKDKTKTALEEILHTAEQIKDEAKEKIIDTGKEIKYVVETIKTEAKGHLKDATDVITEISQYSREDEKHRTDSEAEKIKQQIDDCIDEKKDVIKLALEESSDAAEIMEKDIKTKVADTSKDIKDVVSTMEKETKIVLDDTQEHISEASKEIHEKIVLKTESKIGDVKKQSEETVHVADESIKQGTEELTDSLKEIKDAVEAAKKDTEDHLRNAKEQLNEALKDTYDSFVDKTESKIEESEEHLESTIDQTKEALKDLKYTTGDLEDAAKDIQQTIKCKSENTFEEIKDLQKTIVEGTDTIKDQLDKSIKAAQGKINETIDDVKDFGENIKEDVKEKVTDLKDVQDIQFEAVTEIQENIDSKMDDKLTAIKDLQESFFESMAHVKEEVKESVLNNEDEIKEEHKETQISVDALKQEASAKLKSVEQDIHEAAKEEIKTVTDNIPSLVDEKDVIKGQDEKLQTEFKENVEDISQELTRTVETLETDLKLKEQSKIEAIRDLQESFIESMEHVKEKVDESIGKTNETLEDVKDSIETTKTEVKDELKGDLKDDKDNFVETIKDTKERLKEEIDDRVDIIEKDKFKETEKEIKEITDRLEQDAEHEDFKVKDTQPQLTGSIKHSEDKMEQPSNIESKISLIKDFQESFLESMVHTTEKDNELFEETNEKQEEDSIKESTKLNLDGVKEHFDKTVEEIKTDVSIGKSTSEIVDLLGKTGESETKDVIAHSSAEYKELHDAKEPKDVVNEALKDSNVMEQSFKEGAEASEKQLKIHHCSSETKEESNKLEEKSPSEREVMDEKIVKTEKLLEESAVDLTETFQAVEGMAKTLPFEKCLTQDDKEDESKLDTVECNRFFEQTAKDVEQTFEIMEGMSKSVVFEKCEETKKTESEHDIKKTEERVTGDLDISKPMKLETCLKDDEKEKSDLEKEYIEEKIDAITKPSTSSETSIHKTIETSSTSGIKIEKTMVSTCEIEHKVEDTEKVDKEIIEKSEKETAEKGEKETMEKGSSSTTIFPKDESLPLHHTEDTEADKFVETETSSMEMVSITTTGPSSVGDMEDHEIQKTLLHEKQIPGATTPPTVPVSPNILDEDKHSTKTEDLSRDKKDTVSETSIHSDISELHGSERLDTDEEDQFSVTSQVAHSRDTSLSDLKDSKREDPMSMSFYGKLPSDDEVDMEPSYLYEVTKAKYTLPGEEEKYEISEHKTTKIFTSSLMTSSFIGELPTASKSDEKETKDSKEEKKTEKTQSSSTSKCEDPTESWGKPLGLPAPRTHLFEITNARYSTSSTIEKKSDPEEVLTRYKGSRPEQVDRMTASFYGELPSDSDEDSDPIKYWGKPLGLPSPAPPYDNKGTPKKEKKLPPNVSAKNKLNDDKKRAESPSKFNKNKKIVPVYVDLTYVPHHGNAYYAYVDFFRRIRARYYVFSGIEPSREVYNALLEAKQTWEDKDLEVTIIPTYDTDVLGYWVAENEELLTKCKIDLSPSASRCTINLQDHETSCSAYRLEF